MIELRNIGLRAGPFALDNISFTVPTGAYGVLMGRTGGGKTTILETICGVRRAASGIVLLNGKDMTCAKPADRNLGYVPQDLALFPTMTVREHLEFALRLRRFSIAYIRERVEELAHALSIETLLHRRTAGLSGGEAQRVALGRALSFRPNILLLDEPLNALDETTRGRLCDLLRSVHRQHEFTALHVTHNPAEARLLAEQLLVLESGRILEQSLSTLNRLADPSSSSSHITGEIFRK